jgi:hypothetical protein
MGLVSRGMGNSLLEIHHSDALVKKIVRSPPSLSTLPLSEVVKYRTTQGRVPGTRKVRGSWPEE